MSTETMSTEPMTQNEEAQMQRSRLQGYGGRRQRDAGHVIEIEGNQRPRDQPECLIDLGVEVGLRRLDRSRGRVCAGAGWSACGGTACEGGDEKGCFYLLLRKKS